VAILVDSLHLVTHLTRAFDQFNACILQINGLRCSLNYMVWLALVTGLISFCLAVPHIERNTEIILHSCWSKLLNNSAIFYDLFERTLYASENFYGE